MYINWLNGESVVTNLNMIRIHMEDKGVQCDSNIF